MVLMNGQKVVVAGKQGIIMDVAEKVKVKFEDGNFGFFEESAVTPFVEDTRLKFAQGEMLMHSTAAGEDPQAQPRRTNGRGIGEESTVLGKTISKDVFSKQ